MKHRIIIGKASQEPYTPTKRRRSFPRKVYLKGIVSTLLFVLGRHLELLEVVLGVHHGGVDAVHVQGGSELGPRVLLLEIPVILCQRSVASLDSSEPGLLENMVDLHEDNTIRTSFEKI